MPLGQEVSAKRFGASRPSLVSVVAALCGLVAVFSSALPSAARAEGVPEPKSLAAAVASGELPPVLERLPRVPRVLGVDSACSAEDLGGTLNMLAGSTKDTRLMPVFGYARLVGYDTDYKIVPDILESYDVEEGRVFTFHLRPGMKWSDGAPFTAEDFRYFWQDMAKNPKIAKFGVPPELMVDGEEPEVTFPDEVTVRYAWKKPNPGFLASLAAATPFDIYRPAHYLKKYNPNYTDPKKIEAKVEKSGQRNWVALHFKKDRAQRNDNPDMPTLQPWMLVTEPPSERLIFARNPYFFRVDQAGRQLPYIDEVALTISNSGLIPAKVANGEADLQAAYLSFPNYPFLKSGEKRSNYQVRRWKSGKGAHVALYPNLNAKDPVWRELLQTADFRRALSLAINRKDINQAIFYGLAETGGNTVLPGSPFFDETLRAMWATYDPERANQLLDALGLERDGPDGLRHLPDGREMSIVVETAGESREQSDVLQLVRDDWRKIGIELLIRESQREIFRNRIKAGSTLMSVWTGLDNGLPTPNSDPGELMPSTAEQLEWPGYGMWVETHGTGGEAPADTPNLAPLKTLIGLHEAWKMSLDEAERARIWREALTIFADQVYTIGIVSGVDQIVVVSNDLENVPEQGVYNYDPGAFFGLYHPDTFHFACPGVDTADKRP
ncbi:ABC transporter substrate-binding protein [Aurantimonas sp. 22II-16-19i]|uniref:ABC transporter substrate-binding protein n=1 Tax=Aurantimonas sp. 22II-16-19i TaxID=1317114 RepID=UPI0009F7E58D|nr:ABC transporter substrate-binding protein [Aurantimonas sp. 22II-16-19i]ORE92298.1 oligopeptide ABC transporter periplasmic oligopeptide-binding protein [Aurantimonas sp. 22II-16-19i]